MVEQVRIKRKGGGVGHGSDVVLREVEGRGVIMSTNLWSSRYESRERAKGSVAKKKLFFNYFYFLHRYQPVVKQVRVKGEGGGICDRCHVVLREVEGGHSCPIAPQSPHPSRVLDDAAAGGEEEHA